MTVEKQIADLDGNLGAFSRCVASLAEESFLQPLNGWSPRDIVAHLIGWNRHVIEGSKQIRKGELPFYDVDPGEDFSKVNAALIREYPSRSMPQLLAELRASARELARFLESLEPGEWDRDYGVRHLGEVVTIRSTVDELIGDYDHHREQIAELVGSPRASAPGET